MDSPHVAFLKLLDEIGGHLDRLTELAQQKIVAVRQDDLMELDQILRQEQALALTFRGQDQKRLQLLEQLGMQHVPLSELPAHYPPELHLQAKNVSESLRRRYQVYTTAAEAARNILECNLHEVEKLLAAEGGTVAAGPGYKNQDVAPPKKMQTDFRA